MAAAIAASKMIRPGQLEETMATLPVADARIRPAFANSAVRFLVTKDSNSSITPKEH